MALKDWLEQSVPSARARTGENAVATGTTKSVYFVASHKVLDRTTINDVYLPRAVDCLNKYDVEILCVNESTEIIEGQTGHDRLVILRFPSRDEAMRWYQSPEYQSMINPRLDSVEGMLILAEGLTAEDLAAAGTNLPGQTPAPGVAPAPPRSGRLCRQLPFG